MDSLKVKKVLKFLISTFVVYFLLHAILDAKIIEFIKWYDRYEINSKIEANDPSFVKLEKAHNFTDAAFLLDGMQKYEEALELYKYALSIQRKLNENDHNKDITDLLKNIGELCTKIGKYEEAISYFNQLEKTKREIFGDEMNEDVAEAMVLKASSYVFMSNFDEANRIFSEAESIYKKLAFDNQDDRFQEKLLQIQQAFTVIDIFKKKNANGDENSNLNNQEL